MSTKRIGLFLLLASFGWSASRVDAAAFYGSCALKNVARNKFCRSYPSNDHMITTRNGVGSAEIYDIINLGSGQVAIRESSSGLYLQTLSGSPAPVTASAASSASNAAKFTQADLGSGRYAFKSVSNGQYVRVANDGSNYAWYANGGTTVDSDYERFTIRDCQIDIWAALVAFPTQYPNKVKLKSSDGPPATIRLTTERYTNGQHYWYHVYEDYRFNVIGHPVWDKGGLKYLGDWECWVNYGTLPQYQSGGWWPEGTPRTPRYFSAQVQEDSPGQNVTIQDYNMDCTRTTAALNDYQYGRRYVGWMQDLSVGRGNSQVNMGNRWLVRVAFRDGNESWLVDLGPAIGTFDPKYGIVGYVSVDNLYIWFNNIQDSVDVLNPRCADY